MDISLRKDEDTFVDIHGREIASTTINGKVACFLSDLQQTGVSIYSKTQYQKLAACKKDFGPDFVEHMLEAAKSYMLNNKISFTHDQITQSIENCKQKLNGCQNPETPQIAQDSFFKDRIVTSASSNEISIQVQTTSTPISIKQKSPNFKSFLMETSRQPPIGREKDNSSSDVESDASSQKSLGLKSKAGNCQLQKKPIATPQENKGYNNQGRSIPSKEHDVIVTSIDKPNCIWVRDISQHPLFEKIHMKVNEQARSTTAAKRPWDFNKVYAAMDNNVWFRCKTLKFAPLTVLFLDYGNVVEVNEIREISEDLAKGPFMAIRITFKKSEYTPHLEDKIRIKPFVRNADGTLFVNVLKHSSNPAIPLHENPAVSGEIENPPNSQIDEKRNLNDDDWGSSSSSSKAKAKPALVLPAFFKKPSLISSLQDEEEVVITGEQDGVLFLRDEKGFKKLKEIEKMINDHAMSIQNLKEVKADQLVLYEKDTKLFRGVVCNILKNKIKIELLDYGNLEIVDLSTLKTIEEKLSKEPITCFPGGRLNGYEKKQFGEAAKRKIAEYIRNGKKFIVKLGFDDELDLISDGNLLTEELSTPKNIISLKDMKQITPKIGNNSYICGSFIDSQNLTLVPIQEMQEYKESIIKIKIDDDVIYSPTEGEICICCFHDEWYRCLVTNIFDKEVEVLLLDFGNLEYIKKELIRKPFSNITDAPILGLTCVLTDLPRVDKIEDILRRKIIKGEIYKVDLKFIKDGKCYVQMPSVYKVILNNPRQSF